MLASPPNAIRKAVHSACKAFPFPGYMEKSTSAYSTIAKVVMRHLSPGSKVLDFGCGPCDKAAVLQALGFDCYGYDDLGDDWHNIDGNRETIVSFAASLGIKFNLASSELPYSQDSFDLIMLNDIIEHLHESPRYLLNTLLRLTKPNGYILITVPNAVNLRKRLLVLTGKTNYARFGAYYWSEGTWRGHVREYVKDDLQSLAKYTGMEIVELRSCHNRITRLPKALRPIFRASTLLFSGLRDSWLLLCRKPPNWQPKLSLSRREVIQIRSRETPYRYNAELT